VAYLAYSEVTDSVFVLNIPYIKFGMGASKEVGYEAKRLGITSALLVVGKRLAETKLAEQVRSSLESQGIRVEVFTDVHIEPEDEAIVEGYRKIKDLRVDGFVALGGGSTIDTAPQPPLHLPGRPDGVRQQAHRQGRLAAGSSEANDSHPYHRWDRS